MIVNKGSILLTNGGTITGADVRYQFKTKRGAKIISVVIGMLKEHDSPPNEEVCVLLLGEVGFFPGDLITEVFGEKGWSKFTKAFEEKYDK